MNADEITASKPSTRWLHPTPGRLLVILLAIEGILLACDWFRWTPKGWAVLLAVAAVAVCFEGTRITDAGLKHLENLEQLERLDLPKTRVTDAGLEHLKGLKQLQTLRVDWTHITDAGLKHLQCLKKLRILNLYGTQVTDAGVAELQESLPNCEIVH